MPGGGGKGGGGPSGTTTSVQNTEPWGPQQNYLRGMFREAERLYNGPDPQYFPGATYAPMNEAQRSGLADLAEQPWHDNLPPIARQTNASILSGDFNRYNRAYLPFGSLSSNDSPEATALSSYMSGERIGRDNPYTAELTSNVLSRVVPQLQAGFIRGGTLSSPEAARATSAGAMGALAPLLFQQQQQEEQNQINAANQSAQTRLAAATGLQTAFSGEMNDRLRGLALAPGVDELSYRPYERRLQAGTMQQQLEQQSINDAVQRWNWGQELPYNRFNQYMGGITGNYGGSSVLTQPYFNPPGQSTFGMIGQGLGLIPSAISAGTSLFGLFGGSDRRMKADIKTVGKLDNGLKVYSYHYRDDPGQMKHIGVMADEVEDVNPEAVTTLPPVFGHLAGLKTVDYARATE